MNKTRNSSIELLKIIALVFIVLTHASPFYGSKNMISYYDFNTYASNIQEFIMLLFRYSGHFGNVIFIICSSYFLVSNTKSLSKVISIVVDTFVISILSLIFFSILGFDVSKNDIIKQFFPIIFGNNWFIGCYILFYLAHPILNKAIENMSKNELLKVCIFLIIICSVIQFILPNQFYYNRLIAFISIYFLTAYLKLYLQNYAKNKRINLIIAFISMILHVLFLIIYNFIASKYSIFSHTMLRWYTIMNPFVLAFSFSIFNLFTNYNFKNKIINYISSLSLLFYVIHENYIFRDYVKPLFYQNVFAINDLKILWILLEAVLLLIYGLLMATLYKETIQRITSRIYIFLKSVLIKIMNNVNDTLIKID